MEETKIHKEQINKGTNDMKMEETKIHKEQINKGTNDINDLIEKKLQKSNKKVPFL